MGISIFYVWVIRNKNDQYLFWSNDYGWVDGDGHFDTFTKEEKEKVNLPIEGEWYRHY